MKTIDETFRKLQQRPIHEVDAAVLQHFNMAGPINAHDRDLYEIALGKDEYRELKHLLESHQWTIEEYKQKSVIEFN